MKKILYGLALSSLLVACPAPPAPIAPIVDEEQGGSLLGSLSGYSGGAGMVKVFPMVGSTPTTTQTLATGTIGADGVFSVFLPNSTVMTPFASEITCASIGDGSAADDGCLVDGAGRVAGVAVGVYGSTNTLLGYLQLKSPAFVGNASRTVVHYFATAALKVQVKKTSSGGFPIIDNYYQSYRKGWNLGLITATTTASSSNFDYVIAGTYPRDVRWTLVNSPTTVNAPVTQK
jgi:hypothetical protein